MNRRALLRLGLVVAFAALAGACGRKGAPQRPRRDDEKKKSGD